MEPLRLFLAYSFAPEKLDRFGNRDDSRGISDVELAERVANWIVEFGGGRIQVVRTCDPYGNYVSSAVREQISSSDTVLCLFTKRTQDQMTKLWIASTYVISEASAALMLFPCEEDTHRRLYGLVEEGVDHRQLGMAFHPNKTAPRFWRDELDRLKDKVHRIVDEILTSGDPVPPRKPLEYLAIDKVASIWRSRAVWVETRHRYRVTTHMTTVRIEHLMWRVSSELPELDAILHEPPNSAKGFLRVMPLTPENCSCDILPGGPTHWGFERKFLVVFSDITLNPGDELEYAIAWGYPNAFHDRPSGGSCDDKPNSVGLRTSGRGTVESASLTLRFERDWEGEPCRILEDHPIVFTTDATDLPGHQPPEDFFHKSPLWTNRGRMCPYREHLSNFYQVYRWTSTKPFHGMAKAIWTPYVNYFDTHNLPNRPSTHRPARANPSRSDSLSPHFGFEI